MASLPSQHPSLSLHLSDITLTPLITSAASQSHLESLTSLTSSALASQTAALRLGLGRPTRLMVEYPDRGSVVLHSYLDPHDAALPDAAASGSGSAVHTGSVAASPGAAPSAAHSDPPNPKDDPRSEDAAPMLIGIVVAGSAEEAKEARRAAARLEHVGREFQREWVAESQGHDDTPE
ncbi:hypothetical protein B0J13DRAFT_621488 [Dactylonectria estremocensis]|uniref:Uncharacterized protein n=1 Tax=Dactylonectria estremocensis TaxID=1079267 RepID=A0A9P9F045_9HYPO|nr:hypothetical protein B0J13DRAFT_621488 [Dactylonectria estremocensis]